MSKPRIYKSYVFKDKEPAIDDIRTVVEDHFGRRINRKDLKSINEAGGPSVGCMVGWFLKDTCRPQNVTLEACGAALGRRRIWVTEDAYKRWRRR